MIKRWLLLISIAILTLLIITGMNIYQSTEEDIAEEEKVTVSSNEGIKRTEVKKKEAMNIEEKNDQHPSMNRDISDEVTSIMKTMTLEEKIGQLLVIGFQSTNIDEHVKRMIEDYHVGGIILYDRNMVNPDQVTSLNNELQQLAKNTSPHIPLIISVDQEGGEIVRMREHVSAIPSQQELGQRKDEEEVYSIAAQSGKELKEMGFNVNYAPVLDLSATDSRSYGEDPEMAFQLAKQVISGFASSSIVGTLKHFPGHGRSNIDPHFESSSVEVDRLDLESKDIYPFKQMIEEVDNNQFFVMVTHFIYPAYDEELPASISPVIIKDLLRNELGYDGIVVTDDLEMGAVTELFSYEELGYQAVKAGADLLLVCHTMESQEQVFHGILQAVQNGKLSEDEIDDSVERILTYKLEIENP